VAADFDSPWKEALDSYFDPFLALLFPAVHQEIDWSRSFESLDKEFQQVIREAEIGRRYVDKLVKVWTKAGAECWVLIHIEVQTTKDEAFPHRMFVYNYRIFDRYNKPVASLAVLADDDPGWRPTGFRNDLFGCEVGIRFPFVKLLDLEAKDEEFAASSNPFAKVVRAHLKTRATQGDPVNRRIWKVRLARDLFESGFTAKDVRELFRVIDWIMDLPLDLQEAYWEDVTRIQKENNMPFITTPERIGLQRGLRLGIAAALKIKFGANGLALMPEINVMRDLEKLQTILDAIETAASPDDLRRLWTLACE
jgi:hypothetical protein